MATLRQIAAGMGVSPRTVDRMVAASKAKPFDLGQSIEADPADPRQTDIEDLLPELTPVEVARVALAECVKVDEAAEMRAKAAAMALYARQRDDREMEAWVKETYL